MLAFATAGIMFVGPVIISFIPIMVVGALIFMLGIELMEEALIDTYGKLHKLEYLTVNAIIPQPFFLSLPQRASSKT